MFFFQVKIEEQQWPDDEWYTSFGENVYSGSSQENLDSSSDTKLTRQVILHLWNNSQMIHSYAWKELLLTALTQMKTSH